MSSTPLGLGQANIWLGYLLGQLGAQPGQMWPGTQHPEVVPSEKGAVSSETLTALWSPHRN